MNTDLISKIIDLVGYMNTIIIKDIILFLAGVSVGAMILLLLVGRVLHRIQKVETLGKMTAVQYNYGGKKHYYTQLSNFPQSVEFITQLIIMPSYKKKEYTLADKRRTQVFLFLFTIIAILLIVFGAMLVTHPIII